MLSLESVLIEYTLHRANLTGRAGWYRRAGGEAVRRCPAVVSKYQDQNAFPFDMSLLILFGVEHERESTERERPLTLS